MSSILKAGDTLKFDNGEALVLGVSNGAVSFTYVNLKAGSSCDPNKVYTCPVALLAKVEAVTA